METRLEVRCLLMTVTIRVDHSITPVVPAVVNGDPPDGAAWWRSPPNSDFFDGQRKQVRPAYYTRRVMTRVGLAGRAPAGTSLTLILAHCAHLRPQRAARPSTAASAAAG